MTSIIRVIDISSAGNIHDFQLNLTDEECWRHSEKYQVRLEVEHQALRDEAGDVKTRLVLFSDRRGHDEFVKDLYGVEFQIEPSFFVACEPTLTSSVSVEHGHMLFLEEDPPAFLNLGRGWCAKFVDQGYDHPLVRKGVTIGKGDPYLIKLSYLLAFSLGLSARRLERC
jgi:hypothetical protein